MFKALGYRKNILSKKHLPGNYLRRYTIPIAPSTITVPPKLDDPTYNNEAEVYRDVRTLIRSQIPLSTIKTIGSHLQPRARVKWDTYVREIERMTHLAEDSLFKIFSPPPPNPEYKNKEKLSTLGDHPETYNDCIHALETVHEHITSVNPSPEFLPMIGGVHRQFGSDWFVNPDSFKGYNTTFHWSDDDFVFFRFYTGGYPGMVREHLKSPELFAGMTPDKFFQDKTSRLMGGADTLTHVITQILQDNFLQSSRVKKIYKKKEFSNLSTELEEKLRKILEKLPDSAKVEQSKDSQKLEEDILEGFESETPFDKPVDLGISEEEIFALAEKVFDELLFDRAILRANLIGQTQFIPRIEHVRKIFRDNLPHKAIHESLLFMEDNPKFREFMSDIALAPSAGTDMLPEGDHPLIGALRKEVGLPPTDSPLEMMDQLLEEELHEPTGNPKTLKEHLKGEEYTGGYDSSGHRNVDYQVEDYISHIAPEPDSYIDLNVDPEVPLNLAQGHVHQHEEAQKMQIAKRVKEKRIHQTLKFLENSGYGNLLPEGLQDQLAQYETEAKNLQENPPEIWEEPDPADVAAEEIVQHSSHIPELLESPTAEIPDDAKLNDPELSRLFQDYRPTIDDLPGPDYLEKDRPKLMIDYEAALDTMKKFRIIASSPKSEWAKEKEIAENLISGSIPEYKIKLDTSMPQIVGKALSYALDVSWITSSVLKMGHKDGNSTFNISESELANLLDQTMVMELNVDSSLLSLREDLMYQVAQARAYVPPERKNLLDCLRQSDFLFVLNFSLKDKDDNLLMHGRMLKTDGVNSYHFESDIIAEEVFKLAPSKLLGSASKEFFGVIRLSPEEVDSLAFDINPMELVKKEKDFNSGKELYQVSSPDEVMNQQVIEDEKKNLNYPSIYGPFSPEYDIIPKSRAEPVPPPPDPVHELLKSYDPRIMPQDGKEWANNSHIRLKWREAMVKEIKSLFVGLERAKIARGYPPLELFPMVPFFSKQLLGVQKILEANGKILDYTDSRGNVFIPVDEIPAELYNEMMRSHEFLLPPKTWDHAYEESIKNKTPSPFAPKENTKVPFTGLVIPTSDGLGLDTYKWQQRIQETESLYKVVTQQFETLSTRLQKNLEKFQQAVFKEIPTTTDTASKLPPELELESPSPLFPSIPFSVNEEQALRGYGYVPSAIKQRIKKEINEEMERFKKYRQIREQLVASEVVSKRVGIVSWKHKKLFIGETVTDDLVLKERCLDAELLNPFQCLLKNECENPPKEKTTENLIVHYLKKKIYLKLFEMNKDREVAIAKQVENERYFRLQEKDTPKPHKEFHLGEKITPEDLESDVEYGPILRTPRRQLAVVPPIWKVRVHIFDIPPLQFLQMKQVPWPVQTLTDHLGELTQFMASIKSMEHFDVAHEEESTYRIEDRE